jgi:LacI family transcriptional regulator
LASIREVAEKAGVSIATVSRVINNNPVVSGKVRERVLGAINQCAYVPSVGRRATSFIAMMYTGPPTLGSTYDMALIEGMGQAMGTANFDLVLLNPLRDRKPEETYTQYFLRKGVRGVILRSTVGGRVVCEEIAREDFPVVVVGDHFDHPNLDFVFADSFQTSKQAVVHLLSLGHERIAFSGNDSDDGDHADRYRAYRESIAEAGLGLQMDLVFHIPAQRADGRQLLRKLMSLPQPPTAIFVSDPWVAIGLLSEAREMGVAVPGDLSVIGFDDRDARLYVYPKMTAVCQDARELGKAAFLLLAGRIESASPGRAPDMATSTWLELNQTTGPPPRQQVRILADGTRLPQEDCKVGS